MKTTFTFSFWIAGLVLAAQVPNSSFENWTNMGNYSDPTNWQTSNGNTGNVINVTQVTNAHTGSSAMRMDVWTYQSINLGAIAVSPSNGNFFSMSGQPPTALTGWYISNFVGGDKLQVTTTLQQGGTSVAGANYTITNNTAVYQQFNIPLIYSPQNAVPDSGALAIAEYDATGNSIGLHMGTYVILDDVQFTTVSAVNSLSSTNAIEKIYPNPSQGSTWIEYSLIDQTPVNLSVYDLNGNLVQQLVNIDQQPGRYRVALETSTLSNGLYLVKLQTGGSCVTEKLSVANP